MQNKKPRKYMRDNLYNKFKDGYGMKKTDAFKDFDPYIHSNSTYLTYKKQCEAFADWLSEKGINDVIEAKNNIPNYLKDCEEKGQSAWTILTKMNAIAKAYSISTKEIDYKAPKRQRQDVKRSRLQCDRDRHFSVKNNKALIDFNSCVGLRISELKALHGNQLKSRPDGSYYLEGIKGKGGRVRNVDVIGSKAEVDTVVKLMTMAKDGLVFNKISSAFDCHYYRSVYACRAYKSKARDIDSLKRRDMYICRKDKKGIVYDKLAMKYASLQLGHNRIDVVGLSYLHNL